MSSCPKCNTPGAYVGFSSVECRNRACEHFKLSEDVTCPCCGKPETACGGAHEKKGFHMGQLDVIIGSVPCSSPARTMQHIGRLLRDSSEVEARPATAADIADVLQQLERPLASSLKGADKPNANGDASELKKGYLEALETYGQCGDFAKIVPQHHGVAERKDLAERKDRRWQGVVYNWPPRCILPCAKGAGKTKEGNP